MWPVRGTAIQLCQPASYLSSHSSGELLEHLCKAKWLVHKAVNGTQCYPILWQLWQNPLRDSPWPGKCCAHMHSLWLKKLQTKILPWVPSFSSPGRNGVIYFFGETLCARRGFLNSMLLYHTWPASWVTQYGIIWFLQCLQQNDFIIKAFTFSYTTSDFARLLCF